MLIDAFDFDLPEDLIALRPVSPRDSARLMVVRGPDGVIEDRHVRDLPDLLSAGDVLALNDTRVIRAGLRATRPTRGSPDTRVAFDINLNRQVLDNAWLAFARPAKRLRPGDRLDFADGLTALVDSREDGGEVLLRFSAGGEALLQALERVGRMPLPPYIARRRPPDEADATDYQTTFATHSGSVAAPTAGLHFTPGLLDRLAARGVGCERLTLHVNAGTFLPVKADDLSGHVMHPEWCGVSDVVAERLNRAREAGGRCLAVGTTALRTLESVARANAGRLAGWQGETDIFITPGHAFAATDGLLTNFHLPRSTLFVLVCALMGVDVMQRAYAHAIASRYRFYSYGDACLLLPHG